MDEKRDIPKGWVTTGLYEIGEIVSGGTPSTSIPEYWGGDINWISPVDLSGYVDKVICKGNKSITLQGLNKSSAKMMPKGSVLFSSRAPIGYVAIAGCEVCTNQGFKSVVPNESVFNEYLYYFLKSAKKQADELASGTTFKEISSTNFRKLQIPLAPLPEQRRIVAKIEELFSSLDKGIENLETARQQLKVYRQAVLKWAFEGKLTNENVADGELPEGWNLVRLGEVVEQPKYGTSKKCDYSLSGKGVLRIPNISNGIIDDSDLKYAEFNLEEIETYRLKKGDLLTIRSNGSVDLVGKCARVLEKDENFLFAGYLIRIRPLEDKILSKYLLYVLSSSHSRNQIEAKAKSTSGVNNINSGELKSLLIPICTIQEQHTIVSEIESRLSVCDKIEESIEQSLKQAELLKQSILKKAFEGKLVPQDPDDEPASVLLERIRAERETGKADNLQPKRKKVKAHDKR